MKTLQMASRRSVRMRPGGDEPLAGVSPGARDEEGQPREADSALVRDASKRARSVELRDQQLVGLFLVQDVVEVDRERGSAHAMHGH